MNAFETPDFKKHVELPEDQRNLYKPNLAPSVDDLTESRLYYSMNQKYKVNYPIYDIEESRIPTCNAEASTSKASFSLAEEIAANYDTSKVENPEDLVLIDLNRRTSLGAESLQEHDITEDSWYLDTEGELATNEAFYLGFDYHKEIFAFKREMEIFYHAKDCVANQPQVTEQMRCILVTWLLKVNKELHFGQETVFLAVNLMDRFLSIAHIAHDCLQLLATTVLFVASKMEESSRPWISDLTKLCGNSYKKLHFRNMEMTLLSTIEFCLYSPTSYFFVSYFVFEASLLTSIDKKIVNLGRYVVENVLPNYQITQFYPSIQAASSLKFASQWLCEQEKAFSKFLVPSKSVVTASVFESVFQETFSSQELKLIENCSKLMETFMRPFLESSLDQYQEENLSRQTITESFNEFDSKSSNAGSRTVHENRPVFSNINPRERFNRYFCARSHSNQNIHQSSSSCQSVNNIIARPSASAVMLGGDTFQPFTGQNMNARLYNPMQLFSNNESQTYPAPATFNHPFNYPLSGFTPQTNQNGRTLPILRRRRSEADASRSNYSVDFIVKSIIRNLNLNSDPN